MGGGGGDGGGVVGVTVVVWWGWLVRARSWGVHTLPPIFHFIDGFIDPFLGSICIFFLPSIKSIHVYCLIIMCLTFSNKVYMDRYSISL